LSIQVGRSLDFVQGKMRAFRIPSDFRFPARWKRETSPPMRERALVAFAEARRYRLAAARCKIPCQKNLKMASPPEAGIPLPASADADY